MIYLIILGALAFGYVCLKAYDREREYFIQDDTKYCLFCDSPIENEDYTGCFCLECFNE